jgi:GT2 family glycosyltransferase
MRKPTFICDYELSAPFEERSDLQRFGDARVLLRLHGRPLGHTRVPVVNGRVDVESLDRQIVRDYSLRFASLFAERAIATAVLPTELNPERLLDVRSNSRAPTPTVTVAVCTRDRPDALAQCLSALRHLDYRNLDIVVVDNAPTTEATASLVRDRFPGVRYIREPRPGLDWARNRAILECRGEILAFTDDDVIVDSGWVTALAAVFAASPDVMAVTGLVVPYELETDAQQIFEDYGGFGRGYTRRWYRAPRDGPASLVHGGSGKFGTGANMAFRRQVFDVIGGFDPALDVGTPANGGGDLDMFFRVLKDGHTLVYEPAAIVRHRHRRSRSELQSQIANNGVGFFAYLVRTAKVFRDERIAVLRLGAWWLWWWNIRRLLRSYVRTEHVPRSLIRAELKGSIIGLDRYRPALAQVRQTERAFPEEPCLPPRASAVSRAVRHEEAVRHIDLAKPLRAIEDATAYERVRVFITWSGTSIGEVAIEHHGGIVAAAWLSDVISQRMSAQVLDAGLGVGPDVAWMCLVAGVARTFASRPRVSRTPHDLSVSVVVATRDRPDDLQRCVRSLESQRANRRLEIVVVDNNPASGLTRNALREFPDAVVVNEPRPGLSYARNRGIAAATGDIIVTTDDDVTCPDDWIERLVAPFQRDDVMIVTGNVLPAELETSAQRVFESYGGLGRGWQRRIVDGEWFAQFRRAVPTWRLGCTANAAFRRSIFANPNIGLMDEALGAGTPTGCSEDTYVFYRVLKAGFAIAYEPDAFVWHRHRSSMKAVRRQIYSYAKGHAAYQLTTWLRDGDRRGITRILYELPAVYTRRAWQRIRRHSHYPLRFVLLEVFGTMAGPLALWRSRRRVRRLGRSAPLVPGPSTSTGPGTGRTAAESYVVRMESPRA